ncbi:uncharacterized protein IWZ02DRAFT_11278 [Phyllosticta citriasiana]|uniref:Uncharacterized protein n=1 Tax=Phyllosticta citriasiana TaxID=595635 RepID=A0ABR1KHX7_9PEZI
MDRRVRRQFRAPRENPMSCARKPFWRRRPTSLPNTTVTAEPRTHKLSHFHILLYASLEFFNLNARLAMQLGCPPRSQPRLANSVQGHTLPLQKYQSDRRKGIRVRPWSKSASRTVSRPNSVDQCLIVVLFILYFVFSNLGISHAADLVLGHCCRR